jgi:signal transduction histidine kinase
MPDDALLEKLSQHRTLSPAPRREIEWLATHGHTHTLPACAVLTPKSGPVAGLHIVLSGHITIHVDGPTGRRKVMEWRAGDVTGMMPYSRIVSPPGDVVVEEESDVFTILREDLPAMIRECPELTTIFVHIMLDRARTFTQTFLQDEKMVSLGKLAAGLAHELNNPASALKRSASSLEGSIYQTEAAARALGAAGLSPQNLAAITEIQRSCIGSRTPAVRSPLDQEDRERAIAAWLKKHGASTTAAESLAETDITVGGLDQLAQVLEPRALDLAAQWLASDCSTRKLAWEIQRAAVRVYDLVAAVKGFTQMDRGAAPERVDVAAGIADTIVVLASKAKAKGATLTLQAEPGLPTVIGFAGEMNQIWSNLIDNALDAIAENGRVELTAKREGQNVVVRVIDDGAGIPADIVSRIFDPFFTTKPVGKGTGLGLDIVRRLVQRNNGEIEVKSEPGRTEFKVCLPIADTQNPGATA